MHWIFSILRPDFTWPQPKRPISKTAPPTPRRPGKLQLRVLGLLHKPLYYISEWYTGWYGIQFDPNILELPLGLILKWHDRTSVEEAVAMQMARAAGMPVPKMLSCGEHPNNFRKISILMTRLPGTMLDNPPASVLPFELDEPWYFELQECINSMREWKSPYGEERICSAIGTSLRSSRVPHHIMGPFAKQSELHDFLLSTASAHLFKTTSEYDKALVHANDIRKYPQRIVFTHGDLKAHNILVDDAGHLSGFLDWESAGWMPEYWDFTTAMRFGRLGWWYQVVSWLGGDQYSRELSCDIALNSLTVDSYIFF